MGHEVLDQINSLYTHLALPYLCMGFIQHYDGRFNAIRWSDSNRARQLLNRGLEAINNNPTVEILHPIVCSLIDLMPEDEVPPIDIPRG